MKFTPSTRTQFTIDTIRTASRVVHTTQERLISTAISKEDQSPVTVADFASQAIVSHLLESHYPKEFLIAEENAGILRSSSERTTLDSITAIVNDFAPDANQERVCEWIDRGDEWWIAEKDRNKSPKRFWTLDPIDGTKGFLRGDQYVVALAFVEDGEVQISALGCPNLTDANRPDSSGPGSLIIAVRGGGSWIIPLFREDEFKQIHVSDCQAASAARLLRSFESSHTNVSQIEQFSEDFGIQSEAIRMDSQAKYAVLASGYGELYIRLLNPDKPEYREKIWDQAAGSLIIEEAGGKVTDLFGKQLDFSKGATLSNNWGVFASNGHLHDAGLEALSKL